MKVIKSEKTLIDPLVVVASDQGYRICLTIFKIETNFPVGNESL